jgi:hypothetical protein
MSENDYAFPTPEVLAMGLTKREYIACMALQGILSSVTLGRADHTRLLCKTAINYADMLLALMNGELDEDDEE